MNFNFGEVLARAGRITWKHKNLWWAGIVVTLFGLLPAAVSLVFSPSFFSFSDPSEVNKQLPAILSFDAVAICFGLLSIPVYVIAMSIPSLGTLQLEQGKQSLKLGELTKDTLRYFWRILGIMLLIWLGTVAVSVVFGLCIAGLAIPTHGLAAMCMFPLFLLFIPVGIVVFALVEQSVAAVLVDNLGVLQALQRAWELIKKNFWVMALISILIYLGSMVIGMFLSVPMMVPMFGFMANIIRSGAEPNPQVMAGLFRNMMWWMLAFSPLYAVLQGILLTFMQSVWILTYMRLTKPQAGAPVMLEANA